MAKRRFLDRLYASLEEAVLDWQSMAPVASQLQRPVGGGYADSFIGKCRACAEEIEDRDLRGKVEELTPEVLSIFALGICRHCRCITPYQFLIREQDGELVVQTSGPEGERNDYADSDLEPGMLRLLEELHQFMSNNS